MQHSVKSNNFITKKCSHLISILTYVSQHQLKCRKLYIFKKNIPNEFHKILGIFSKNEFANFFETDKSGLNLFFYSNMFN